ncbi:MAG: glycosyltransferase family 39 protein, partial [Terriglobus roseus]|nr:glycosyltransferase family 39 protein [Terriglobus roseus]
MTLLPEPPLQDRATPLVWSPRMTSTHAGPAFSTSPGPKQDPDQGSELAKVTSGKFRDFIWADWIMFAMVCSIMVSLTVVRSRTHLLWADELFTRSMITPPSVKTTLLGSYKGADGGGVLFYLLARGWYLIFGDSALALRLFSTLGMCSALLFTWAGARRYFAPLPVGLAVALMYLSTPVLLWQNDNARFYGLFLASAALASYLFLKSAEQPLTRLELVALAAAHSGLIGSHILGIAYSFALITGMVLLDLSSQRLRPSLY